MAIRFGEAINDNNFVHQKREFNTGMEQNSDDGADKVEASKGSVEQTPNSPESGAWSRGQVLEAVLNVQMDFDVSKKQWDRIRGFAGKDWKWPKRSGRC